MTFVRQPAQTATGSRLLRACAALLVVLAGAACAPQPTPTDQAPGTASPSPTHTLVPTTTPRPTATPDSDYTLTPVPTLTPEPTQTVPPTLTPEPTLTLNPTRTVAPTLTPEPTPIPNLTRTPPPTTTVVPTSTLALEQVAADPNSVSVCGQGCDFAAVQAAIDHPSTQPGIVIYIMDPVHTEAGITIGKDLTIQGLGPDRSIIQAHPEPGQAKDRVFFIPAGALVAIRDLTIRHGSPVEDIRSGGGIENRGTLALSGCVLRDNQANCGGGIYNEGGRLTLIDCALHHNLADGQGPPGYGCGSGGAVKVTEGSSLSAVNSSFYDNHGKGKGGAVHVSCTSRASLTNCTISGNSAVARGGGISAKGEVSLTHCTITGNSAKGVVRGKPVKGQAGGGVSVGGTLHYTNTLIANNPNDGDCALVSTGAIGANSHNLVEDGSCQPALRGDFDLEPLAANGGPTWTRALLPGSLAVDAVPARDCVLETDQRGQPRPIPPLSPDTPCDIGAFELP